jgi:hypothetical protein
MQLCILQSCPLNGVIMIIVPRKFIFVGALRTGSHFIYDILMKNFPGAIRTVQHHEMISDVIIAKKAHELPLYTVVRNPLYVIHSLWKTFHLKYPNLEYSKTFAEFLETKKPFENGAAPYNPKEGFPPGHLTMYQHVADMMFPFEPNFTTFFNFIGLNGIIETEPKEVDTVLLPATDVAKTRKYFAADYDIYENKLFYPDKVA